MSKIERLTETVELADTKLTVDFTYDAVEGEIELLDVTVGGHPLRTSFILTNRKAIEAALWELRKKSNLAHHA